MYNVEWVDAAGQANYAHTFLQPGKVVDVITEKGDVLKVPQWQHPGDFQVVRPADVSQDQPDVTSLDMCIASFDGGAAQKLGVGGYCFQARDG